MLNRVRAFVASLFLVLALSSGAAWAQTLNTPSPDNNGNTGLLFDIQAVNAITVTNVTSAVQSGSNTYTLYGRSGTYVGNDTSSAGWVVLGTQAAAGSTVSFNFSQPLAANQTYAFYIHSTGGGGVQYRNGPPNSGGVWASDSSLIIRVGHGAGGLFNGVSNPNRGLVGSITYAPPVYEVPTLSEWAMILLVLSLAGAGVVMLRRRATL